MIYYVTGPLVVDIIKIFNFLLLLQIMLQVKTVSHTCSLSAGEFWEIELLGKMKGARLILKNRVTKLPPVEMIPIYTLITIV